MKDEDPHDPLTVCKKCGKLVMKTNYCIFCTAPILAKPRNKPRDEGDVKASEEAVEDT